jgi:hypothetical protein
LRSKFGAGDGKGEQGMRTLTVAAALLALLVLPAEAQMGGGRRHGGGDDKKADQKKPQIDEKAYKEALKRIPEPKEKYDPWSGARPTDQKPTK